MRSGAGIFATAVTARFKSSLGAVLFRAVGYRPYLQRQYSYSGISSSAPPLDGGCLLSQTRYSPGGQDVNFLAGFALWLILAQAEIVIATTAKNTAWQILYARTFILISDFRLHYLSI
jgi:hypothetical protein